MRDPPLIVKQYHIDILLQTRHSFNQSVDFKFAK